MAQRVETGRDGASGRSGPPPVARWFLYPAWALTLVGLGISVYLTVAHYRPRALVCSASGVIDCSAVTTSKYSELLGIPMPLLGLAFFVGFAVLITPPLLRSPLPLLRWSRLAAVSVGVLFVVYLITAEVILRHLCQWCTGVHIVTILLFVLVLSDEFRRIGQIEEPPRRTP
ncbi:vitamin K epoxide reductase family protein [Actinomadura rayongensis]|uniref:Vitamin K epoxide reductase n=1 Tax=Actinomadura rayongensis TaxID=1429076 RepID=A0A6I4WAK5_9ACTN|nr:vitamin K epoxide reductase family protein [Actinomadura rayongensis]MXQ64104.1 Vitamin K epoxide reductase [Actinomadura rayongensis]